MDTRKNVYAARHFAFAGVRTAGRGRFKIYLIDATQTPTPHDAPIEDALSYVEGMMELGRVDPTATGHLILHHGEEALWLLAQWWVEGGIMKGVTASAAHDLDAFTLAAPNVIACVWEQIVIEHERRAWVRTMMAPRPNLNSFLADTLPDGVY